MAMLVFTNWSVPSTIAASFMQCQTSLINFLAAADLGSKTRLGVQKVVSLGLLVSKNFSPSVIFESGSPPGAPLYACSDHANVQLEQRATLVGSLVDQIGSFVLDGPYFATGNRIPATERDRIPTKGFAIVRWSTWM